MIIELEKEYEKHLIKSGIDNKVIHGLNIIFQYAYDNKLFFRASLYFFEFLRNSLSYDSFSRYSKLYIEFFIEHHLRIMSETKHIMTLIYITDDDHVAPMRDNCFATFDMLPYELIPRIYGENIDDSKFYKKLFNTIPHGYQNNICLEADSFNGDNVGNFTELMNAENKKIFLTIIDSDKDYADADYGKTAADFLNEYRRTKPYFCFLKILNVREKENLMPIQFMNISSAEVREICNYISTLDDDVKNYYDLKSGVKNTVYKEKGSDIKWKAIYDAVIAFAKSKSYFHIEAEAGKYQHIKGVGKNITNDLSKIDKNTYMSLLTQVQCEDLNCIFELIVRFGFTYDVQKII